ncbi:MAG: prolipoprotein diacylglyceryl transferase [Bordetella sp.]
MTSSVFVHPQFDPVAVSLGPLAIHWYGLMYLLAFASFYALGRWQIRLDLQRSGMTVRDLEDLLVFAVLGVVLGGRLGYVAFYQPNYFLNHPLEALAIWQGGMAFHGGLLGVIFVLALFAARRPHLGQALRLDDEGLPLVSRPLFYRQRFWALADYVAPLVPLGLAFGRLGNFINGELWGRPADPNVIPWAMIFPQSGTDLARHPSQLYQFFAEGLLLFALLFFLSCKSRPRGVIASCFLLGYGFFRFLAEFGRQPDAFLGLLPVLEPLGLTVSLSMGQWLSIPMMVLGLVGFFVFTKLKDGRAPERL